MSDLPTVEFKWSAREDLEAEVDEINNHNPELEHGGFIAGYVDDRGRVVVEAIRRNDSKPFSPTAVQTDAEAMARFEEYGSGRIVGDWHSHPVLGPPEPSQADYECWRRAAERLDQPYVGVVLAPDEEWAGNAPPRATWESTRGPLLSAWMAWPNGTILRCQTSFEPRWYADAASKVRFRGRQHA